MTFDFDNSLLGDFTKCEAQAVVKHVLGRQARRKKLYGDLGNVAHKALDEHFGGADRNRVGQVFELEYDKVVPVGETPEEEMMSKSNLKTVIDVYCEKRPVGSFPWEVVEQEKTVGVELEDGLKMWFKRDMLVRDKKTGLHYPVDHKTRWGQINEWWTKKFRKCSQFTGYIWATRELTGDPVDKIYVNALSCGKLPDSTRKCRVHGVPYLECRRQHVQFELLIYPRLEEQIEKWRRDVVHWAKQARGYFEIFNSVEMLPHALRRGEFNEGCTFCEFADWCREGFAADLMEEYTIYEPWRPWEEHKPIENYTFGRGIQKGEDGNFRWWYIPTTDKIAPDFELSKAGPVNEIPQAMALKKLWDQGEERWMFVWKNYPEVHEVMTEFAKEKGGK